MKDYLDFFYNFNKDMEEEFGESFDKIKKLPKREFKFTCHLGYEYEIIIDEIQLLDYPLMIEDTYINYLDKNIPCFLTGVRYSMTLLHNGSGLGDNYLFSNLKYLYSDLCSHFHRLFASNYFSSNFIREIGKENVNSN